MSLLQRLASPGPKRILSLDGGGIRGALTLGYLQQVEDILRAQNGGSPDFRLSDYFDLIGGTSTGSIIAACLATGMKVEEIKEKYFALGGKIFAKKKHWWTIGKLALLDKAQFDAQPLETALEDLFGDMTMGSDKILTGLCIVAKRADTNSTWPIVNNPNGKYFNSKDGTNKDILLSNAVRASAAAPTYFVPEKIGVGGGSPEAYFVDGGVSMANNPALQLLMVATLKGFRFNWEMGPDKLFIVSVGTGFSKMKKLPAQITNDIAIMWAATVPEMLMQDASILNQTILQWMSKSPTAMQINGEMGDLADDTITTGTNEQGLISYLRYNTLLSADNLEQLMGHPFSEEKVDDLVEMSHAYNCKELYEIGEKAGRKEIMPPHFPEVFKLK